MMTCGSWPWMGGIHSDEFHSVAWKWKRRTGETVSSPILRGVNTRPRTGRKEFGVVCHLLVCVSTSMAMNDE